MPGHRRLHGDRGRLRVTNLTHEDHIRILPQHRAQDGNKCVSLPVVDRDLRATFKGVLDRILDGDRVALFDVDLAQATVERGRLARTGRATDQQQAGILRGNVPQLLVHPGRQAELMQTGRSVR
ncbi:MAG: hypothetical protein EA377_11915 [Phycisphaerales bacterium]|nr:MAG: hypothetical protein EA377_11915 [Phycisphaerales bacterium]